MTDQFVHLWVASGYSMQYGACHPGDLVARAAELGMGRLALTDRDGMYGAVRFAKACLAAGVQPIIGVDLAAEFSSRHPASRIGRAPAAARGGASDELWRAQQLGADRALGMPRVVVLARSRAGWARLCRLVSAVHLRGKRGVPVAAARQIAEYCADGELVVMLGADSELGMAVSAGDRVAADAELARWRQVIADDQLVLAVTDQLVGGQAPGSLGQAARLLRMADEAGLGAVLTNNVRMAERRQAMTCDVLDSARRLMALDPRAIDRRNAEGWLKPGALMRELARGISRAAGRTDDGARLWRQTIELGDSCALDPVADIGLGEIHLPEFTQFGTTSSQAPRVLRQRCEAGIAARYPTTDQQVWRRLDEELDVISQLGYESYFLTVAEVVDLIGQMGIRCAARGSGAGSLVNYLLGISGVDPLAHRLLMERFLSPRRQGLPDIDLDVESERRTEIYARVLEVFGGERVSCVAMLETYRVRHA
ncbi:MAG: PHP domain-containing protein, partial [Brooklawnia sp.]